MRLKNPTYSSARSGSIKQFFSRLEKYFDHQEINDERVEVLGLCLQSTALEAYDSLRRNDEEIEYNQLK